MAPSERGDMVVGGYGQAGVMMASSSNSIECGGALNAPMAVAAGGAKPRRAVWAASRPRLGDGLPSACLSRMWNSRDPALPSGPGRALPSGPSRR
jgi:hypothetical protein